LSRTEGADVQDRVAIGGEHRPDTCDGVIGTADEKREGTRGDVVRTAADRGVDDIDARRLDGDRLYGARASGGVNDEN
jgi:hypothetical protein